MRSALHASDSTWIARAIACTLSLIGLVFLPSAPEAQQLQTNLWVTDGTVYSVVRSGGIIYVGGEFNEVGPVTGALLSFETDGDTALKPYPMVVGYVRTIAPDGHGGVYIGGTFTTVRGEARNNLAQLDANGNLTLWNPNPNQEVWAIAVDGNTVYVGGFFSNVGAQDRNGIAALNATTGVATSWDPHGEGGVMSLAFDGGTVYAGGVFTSMGGQPRNRLAAIDAAAGAVTAWNPNVTAPVNNAPAVFALAVDGGTVYAGGQFEKVGVLSRRNLAAIDATTGIATGWNPSASADAGWIEAIAISGGTVYVGGTFNSIGGQARFGLAGVDEISGSVTSWDPSSGTYNAVNDIAVDGNTVYVTGLFDGMGGQSRRNLAAIDAISGDVTNWNPTVCHEALALSVQDGKVYVGGGFTCGTDCLTRHSLAALDATTGQATNWNPDVTTLYYPYTQVKALAVDGGTVYAGGNFNMVGGEMRCGLAAIDATTGLATSWNPFDPYPGPDDCMSLTSLALDDGKVYIAGTFTTVGGQPRHNLAAIDATTGEATSWDPNPDGSPAQLVVSGSTIYAAGGFSQIGGQPRSSLAALDVTTGEATSWDPNPDYGVHTLAIDGGIVYVGGYFTSMDGQPRNGLAALDAATGELTSWDPRPGSESEDPYSEIYALAVDGNTVYVGGYFTSIGGQGHVDLAAIDATTGQATLWHPNPDGYVLTFAMGGGTLYAGGGFTVVHQVPYSNLAAFTFGGVVGVETPVAVLPLRLRAAPNPFHNGTTIQFSLPASKDVELGVYDIVGRLVRHLQSGVLPAGEQRLVWDGRNDAGRDVSVGLYVVRMHAASQSLNTKVFRLR